VPDVSDRLGYDSSRAALLKSESHAFILWLVNLGCGTGAARLSTGMGFEVTSSKAWLKMAVQG
jgi:hypothetical protein